MATNYLAAADGVLPQGGPHTPSPLSQSVRVGSNPVHGDMMEPAPVHPVDRSITPTPAHPTMYRTESGMSQSKTLLPSRGGTLKKRQSLKRTSSIARSMSRRSMAGSVKSLALADNMDGGDNQYSAFYTPVPTSGNPTELLAARFQEWRRVLKDLGSYFREVQKNTESRAKSLSNLTSLVNSISTPSPVFSPNNDTGLSEASTILRKYHTAALAETNRARTIEDGIIEQLNGLRQDLGNKIKEIKNLQGDFKNSVIKETESTRRAVRTLTDALSLASSDPSLITAKNDPFIVRLGVEKQIEKQIDEENYLHQAFLNLEHSGHELESIVVGEIQKAYSALATILTREADETYDCVDSLRAGPLAVPRDQEWETFLEENGGQDFVDPKMDLRKSNMIEYEGKTDPRAAEIRSGMLERKSKYLKSYTPGWYVLSSTHLHEFKSPTHISQQSPIMSLDLRTQSLGSHSSADSASRSYKFLLKSKQSGGRMLSNGHNWVFRAESHEKMMEWYEDIKALTEKTGAERDGWVRRHARSVSIAEQGTISSDGGFMEDDAADKVPYLNGAGGPSRAVSGANGAVGAHDAARPSTTRTSDISFKPSAIFTHIPPSRTPTIILDPHLSPRKPRSAEDHSSEKEDEDGVQVSPTPTLYMPRSLMWQDEPPMFDSERRRLLWTSDDSGATTRRNTITNTLSANDTNDNNSNNANANANATPNYNYRMMNADNTGFIDIVSEDFVGICDEALLRPKPGGVEWKEQRGIPLTAKEVVMRSIQRSRAGSWLRTLPAIKLLG